MGEIAITILFAVAYIIVIFLGAHLLKKETLVYGSLYARKSIAMYIVIQVAIACVWIYALLRKLNIL